MAASNFLKATVKGKSFNVHISDSEIRSDDSAIDVAITPTASDAFSIVLDNSSFEAHISELSEKNYKVTINGNTFNVALGNKRDMLLEKLGISDSNQNKERNIVSPMPGLVLDILVKVGDEVQTGTGLVILEAMKMENEIKASAPGVIKAIHVHPGDAIKKNDLIIEIGQ